MLCWPLARASGLMTQDKNPPSPRTGATESQPLTLFEGDPVSPQENGRAPAPSTKRLDRLCPLGRIGASHEAANREQPKNCGQRTQPNRARGQKMSHARPVIRPGGTGPSNRLSSESCK
jgi:hypothetical protein